MIQLRTREANQVGKGYWTCNHCGKVTGLIEVQVSSSGDPKDMHAVCGLCESPDVTWHGPVRPERKQFAVPADVAHVKFEAIRRMLEDIK